MAMRRDHLEHDLFLLMINLSQLRDADRIRRLFIDAINSIDAAIGMRYVPDDAPADGEAIPIATTHHTFGRMRLSPEAAQNLPENLLALIRDGVRMLAIILENRWQDRLLSEENLRLEASVQNRTAELVATNAALKREIQERKREAIATLAGGIAHDYNNLLFIALGNISMAMEGMAEDDPSRNLLRIAENACLRSRDLTRELTTYSHGGRLHTEPGPISTWLEKSVRRAVSSDGVSPRFDVADDLWPVDYDREHLRHVIANLVLNACQAMPGGGDLRVSAENVRLNGHGDIPLEQGDYVKISIRDTGRGIPSDHIQKIFDPYFSTRERGSQKGMGLGLSTADAIIRQHRGHIAVESENGGGAAFHIYLPAAQTPENETDPLESAAHAAL
jgi:signal transduction histidine kinase